jgi:hypothetical protein
MALTTLATLGIIAGATVGIVQGVQAGIQAEQQADIAEFNQKLALRNAEQANINAAAAEKRANAAAEAEQNEYARKEQLAREEAARTLALNRALMGESGVEASAGSSLLVTLDNVINGELNALEVRREGLNRAEQIRYQGQLSAFENRLQAASYKGEAKNYSMQKKAYKQNALYSYLVGAPMQGVSSGIGMMGTFAAAGMLKEGKAGGTSNG